MLNKKLIQILLPLYDEQGKNFSGELFNSLKAELTEKFGGLTIYTRSPATGLWKENDQKITRDEIVIYEVIAGDADLQYWKECKERLEKQFRQDEIMIRFSDISLIS